MITPPGQTMQSSAKMHQSDAITNHTGDVNLPYTDNSEKHLYLRPEGIRPSFLRKPKGEPKPLADMTCRVPRLAKFERGTVRHCFFAFFLVTTYSPSTLIATWNPSRSSLGGGSGDNVKTSDDWSWGINPSLFPSRPA